MASSNITATYEGCYFIDHWLINWHPVWYYYYYCSLAVKIENCYSVVSVFHICVSDCSDIWIPFDKSYCRALLPASPKTATSKSAKNGISKTPKSTILRLPRSAISKSPKSGLLKSPKRAISKLTHNAIAKSPKSASLWKTTKYVCSFWNYIEYGA